MRIQETLLLIVAAINFLLAVFILVRNPKNLTNILFAILNISAALWAACLAGFILSDTSSAAITWAKCYYTAAALIALFFYFFSLNFTGNWKKFNRKRFLIALTAFLAVEVLILGSPSFMLTSIEVHDWGKEVILNRTGYILYSVYFSAFVLAGFFIIYKSLKKANGLFKTYLKFLFYGLIVAFGLGATFNLIYPAFGNYRYIWVGPVFILVYTVLTSYAIVKHKLFDIRGFVVRTLAYILTFTFIGVLFIVPALLLTSFILDASLKQGTVAALVIITLLTALVFQGVRRYFNEFSSKLFYRDYYNSQDVLDKISNLLVGSVDLDEIESQTRRIIEHSIRPSYTKFHLKGDERSYQLSHLLSNLNRSGKSVTVYDDIDINRRASLRESMRQFDMAVAVRLNTRQEELGYIFLGFKQSGSAYSADDQKLLSILADEIALGLQNALRFKEISQFNETLQLKIDAATKELRSANTKLKELDQTKDEFISMASHQLRTPLTTIKGYLSMILEGDVGAVKKEQEPLLKQAFDSSQNMVDLIADLLNVSRLQSGKFVIDNKPTQLTEMVDTEVKRLSEQAAAKDIKLEFKKPSEIPLLNLDATKIRQVVMNFLDNAIYYTPNGGSITVELLATKDSVTYTVTDTGVGVPREVQRHLFTKFYRADNARKMRPDGTGLGLFMAKKVIAAQGGAIVFSSTEGKGSTFGFSFPRSKVELRGDTPKTAAS